MNKERRNLVFRYLLYIFLIWLAYIAIIVMIDILGCGTLNSFQFDENGNTIPSSPCLSFIVKPYLLYGLIAVEAIVISFGVHKIFKLRKNECKN